jgi:hypothetical protein
MRDHTLHAPRRNAAMAILGVRDDIQDLGNVGVTADARESNQDPTSCMGRDVVVADLQHFCRFGGRSAVGTVPSYKPIESIQLSDVNIAVFTERDVDEASVLVHVLPCGKYVRRSAQRLS